MKLIIVLLGVLLIGCDSKVNTSVGSGEAAFERCIDGVTYIMFKTTMLNQGYGYASVKFGRDSKVVLCNNVEF